MSLNTLGVSGDLKPVYDKGVEMMEKRIRGSVSMLTTLKTQENPNRFVVHQQDVQLRYQKDQKTYLTKKNSERL